MSTAITKKNSTVIKKQKNSTLLQKHYPLVIVIMACRTLIMNNIKYFTWGSRGGGLGINGVIISNSW